MTFPSFYKPDKVGTLYMPNVGGAVIAGQRADVRSAAEDTQRVLLLLVDPQVDFIHTDGALSVPGAIDDTRRTIEWLFKNLERVTGITVSLDTHVPLQIFYQGWWMNEKGEHPPTMTSITVEDVEQGHWRPLVEPEWSREYIHQLEKQAKKTLMIWPYHTMLGTPGHSITPALYEAIIYHSEARQTRPTYLVKGSIPRTEHYSVLEPEVKVPEEPLGTLNTDFLKMAVTYDLIYVAGQAKSHCVIETVTSIVNYADRRPGLIEKLHLLDDCMSSVPHPEIDFEAMANQQLERFAEQGLHRVTTKDPIG